MKHLCCLVPVIFACIVACGAMTSDDSLKPPAGPTTVPSGDCKIIYTEKKQDGTMCEEFTLARGVTMGRANIRCYTLSIVCKAQ